MIRKILVPICLFAVFIALYSTILNNYVLGAVIALITTIIFYIILIKIKDSQKLEKKNYQELITICESLLQGAKEKKPFTKDYLLSCLNNINGKLKCLGDNYETIFMSLGEYFVIPEFDILSDIVVKNYKSYETMEKAISNYLLLLHFNEKKHGIQIRNSTKKLGGFFSLWVLTFSFLITLSIWFKDLYVKLLDSSFFIVVIAILIGFNLQMFLCFIYKRKVIPYVIQRNHK